MTDGGGDPSPSAESGPQLLPRGLGRALVNDVPLPAVAVNKPTDGGATFADAVVVAVDRYSDKERLAIDSR